MKATSFVFVVLIASLFAGCAEEKAKPTPDPSKAAAATPASSAAPAESAKPAEKKEEGGW